MATRKKGLGRGLDELLGEDSNSLQNLTKNDTPTELPLKSLQAGRYQPRTQMDEQALADLAQSILAQGIMQPILVRPLSNKKGKYEIIAGERRFRAAKLAKLNVVPVLVREVADENAAAMALIENIQREDLNPLEEAQGVRRLLDEFGLTHEQAATAIGRSRSTTSNILRLLNLSQPVQLLLMAGDIDMGHARALLSLDSAQQIMLANEVAAKKLSVRETEKKVNRLLNEIPAKSTVKEQSSDSDKDRLEQKLSDLLATSVKIKTNKRRGGQLLIDFTNWEHLNELLEKQGLNAALSD